MADVLTLKVREIDRWLCCDADDNAIPALPPLDLAGNGDGKSSASAAQPLILAIDPRPVGRLWELAEAGSDTVKGKPD